MTFNEMAVISKPELIKKFSLSALSKTVQVCRAEAAISLFFQSTYIAGENLSSLMGKSKHKEVNIYAHYTQMLNGKTNIVGII